MNYGLYLSASGVLTNTYRQDVFANNLANVETVGFKRDIPTLRQRPPEAIEDGTSGAGAFRHALLDRLGGGVLAGEARTDFSPAPVKLTGNPLDLALESPHAFFAVSATDPATGERAVRLTRDGRFTRDGQGYLVMAAGGHRVLDADSNPIRLHGDAPVSIDATGRIRQAGGDAGQVQITGVTHTDRLIKAGQNLFAWEGKADVRTEAPGASVRQGAVESSGVDPIRALMDLIEATKAAANNANMIRYHDALMERAVNTLGRVA